MSAFESGLSQGRGIVNDALDRQQREKEFALREAAAARDAEKFGWERDAVNRESDAFSKYETLNAGVGSADQGQIKQTSLSSRPPTAPWNDVLPSVQQRRCL
jgi:hypothetical protein